MIHALTQMNYLAVLAAAVAGFMLGSLWFGPLCGKAWMVEMKITPEKMKDMAAKGMAPFLVKGFLFTLLSTVGLAVLLRALGNESAVKGAAVGAFVGLVVVGARMLNGSVWEERSMRLMAILVGHEMVLFALQGAILGAWR